MKQDILPYITDCKAAQKKLLAVLLDPDKVIINDLHKIIRSIENNADFIFVGGSTVADGDTQKLVIELKKISNLPVILFPGDHTQIAEDADAILFLSLLSGNNPEYLIGQQLKSVPKLRMSELEIIPTGYILIDGTTKTSVQTVSNTKPIPNNNIELAVNTAVAGKFLGKKMIYLEAGSGAQNSVPLEMIKEVSENIDIPLIVGGGIRTKEQLENTYKNGADIVVIGTAFEENTHFFDII
ncbi:MAG: geranylgeranylglyceryl/heptaprenylglyceryl phosphate synthase [Flavobacteriaceae bacterium]|nr:geranylgeranylglyceryl/heptaprenylglyceryl phosphate synthase [Flavobacteriaceae bacterium]